jgi:class 3 adenylate cyclase
VRNLTTWDDIHLDRIILEHGIKRVFAPVHAIKQYVDELSNQLQLIGDYGDSFALFEEFDERIESIRKRQREAEELVEYLVALRKSDKDESHDYAEAQQELRQKLNVISLQTEHIRLKTAQDSRFLNLVKWCERISREVQRAASETVEGNVSRQALDQMFAMQRTITDHSAMSIAELGGQRIMVVDDDDTSRDQIADLVSQMNCEAVCFSDSLEARDALDRDRSFSLIVTELILPGVTGLELIARLAETRNPTPAIVVASVSDVTLMERAFQVGASDFITKPASPIILRTRIRSAIQRKWLSDQKEQLLSSIIPKEIIPRWDGGGGEQRIADRFEHAGILFADLCGFTAMSDKRNPEQVIVILQRIFGVVDNLIRKHGAEKIKTIGDAYMIASGIPNPVANDEEAARPLVELALELGPKVNQLTRDFRRTAALPEFQFRIGIHVGQAVAGVIGLEKFAYDIWGSSVNVASRMESHGEPGMIHVTQRIRDALGDGYAFEDLGEKDIKSLGRIPTYSLLQRL